MKVEVKEAVFRPVVITIETQEELDAVNEALGFFMDKAGADGVARALVAAVRELYVALP